MYNESERLASGNLTMLGKNPYAGRGLVIGVTPDNEHVVQVYWIMGRSESSRNRIFSSERGRVYTEAADVSKVALSNPLIYYNAMDERDGCFVVSNGDHTDSVLNHLLGDVSFANAVDEHNYEPDEPHYTSRIVGVHSLQKSSCYIGEMAILRKSPWDRSCERFVFRYESIEAGFGFCIHTYTSESNPLPPFVGEPVLVPICSNEINLVAAALWATLNETNRVALAVKFIPVGVDRSYVHIINKYKKV